MGNALTEWRPNRKQERFLSLPDSIDEALYGGAAGAGKSEILIVLPIIREWICHPKFKGILFRRTFPELESEIIVRAESFYLAAGGKYSSDKKRWRFPSGAIIQFGHMEYKNDVRKYDTTEYNYAGFDELTSFFEYQYIYFINSRLRTSYEDLPVIARAGTNPGNIGHTWVKNRFIDPAPYGTIIKETVTNKEGKEFSTKRIFIQALLSDNKENLGNQYEAKLLGLPEAEKNAKLYGEWTSFEGQVFSDWREEVIPGEPENAVHVINPFPIPDWWPKVIATDWGFAAMMCTLWFAISPDNRIYIYREYTCKKTRISEWGKRIKDLSLGENFKDIVLCKSAWQDRGEPVTIADQYREATGFTPRKADADSGSRITSKVLIQEYLRFKPIPDNEYEYNSDLATQILRIQGLAAYKSYLKSFEPRAKEKLPKLQVFNTCEQLILTIPRCIYDSSNNVTGKVSEDVKEFDGDDPYDCLRYGVMACSQFLNTLNQEFDFRQKIDDAVKSLSVTGDQTSYYRKMEHIERNLGNYTPQPVKRGSVYRR